MRAGSGESRNHASGQIQPPHLLVCEVGEVEIASLRKEAVGAVKARVEAARVDVPSSTSLRETVVLPSDDFGKNTARDTEEEVAARRVKEAIGHRQIRN